MAPTLGMARKILSFDQLLARREEARQRGMTVVHCHGCFDIVHPGHVRHLEFAARQGDILLVSVSADSGVNKGANRPLIPHDLRAENLAALNCVDWVHVDSSATAQRLLDAVKPDLYIKGQEYETNRDPRFLAEKAAVERHGGRVVFSSGDVVFSSTALIEAMTSTIDPVARRLDQLDRACDLRPSTLETFLARFRGLRTVVIGDTILDSYIHCEQPEISKESPMLTLRPVERQTFDGGAAIVANHLASLGPHSTLVTILPERGEAEELRARLDRRGIDVCWTPSPAPLMEKQRYLVGHHKVMKVDHGRPLALDEASRDRFVARAIEAARAVGGADAVILCDFGQGLLTPAALSRIIEGVRGKVGLISGDVSGRRSHLLAMRGLDLVCPSEHELRAVMGDFADGLNAVAWRWFEQTGVRSALVTMGPEGVVAFSRLPATGATGEEGDRSQWRTRLRSEHVPALGPPALDELGCGDALLAGATLALAAGGDLLQGAYLGSLAAAIEARTPGNMPVTALGLRAEWTRLAARRITLAAG